MIVDGVVVSVKLYSLLNATPQNVLNVLIAAAYTSKSAPCMVPPSAQLALTGAGAVIV
jgi:hypothetical protein